MSSKNLLIGGWQSCAPEYIKRDNVKYTFQGDIYSLAIFFYVLMTQDNPYPYTDPKKDSVVETKMSQIRAGERPTINASLPRALVPIIERAWAQNPTYRPTASELLAFLFTMPLAPLEEMKTTNTDMPPARNEQIDTNVLDSKRMGL